ncbi:MAG: hypothetical protein J7L34_03900 [Thermotogaceae bacterium]|nr:hypothetical protein [Thermotogaceae bacterium]
MIIAITGKPGSGKTSLIKRLIERIGGTGFYTEEVRDKGKRIGFVAVTSWGNKVWLAKAGAEGRKKVGKYTVFVEDFESKVVKKLTSEMKNENLVYIDEIGKMEMLSGEFKKMVGDILNMNKIFIVTVPEKNFHYLVRKVKEKAALLIDAWQFWDKKGEAVEKIVSVLRKSRNE